MNYTLGNEDARFEMEVLPPDSGHVVAVADCGSRLIPLLARFSCNLTAVDISPQQLASARLRLALLGCVDVERYKQFLGYRAGMSPSIRREVFERLPLPADAERELRTMLDGIDWRPPLYMGRFERMLIRLSRINRAITGRAGRRLFDFTHLADQLAYLKQGFPQRRWSFVVAVLGNSVVLNALLYRKAFPEKNAHGSCYGIYKALFDRLLTADVARRSFFLQMIFLGSLIYEEGFPAECDPAVFAAAQSALRSCRLRLVCADVLETVRRAQLPVDFLSLSDVPSFFDDHRAASFLEDIRPYMASGATTVVRGHMRVVAPSRRGYRDTSSRFAALAVREATQLWTINTYQAV